MIMLEQNRIEIDGRPQLILSGEIHYFRLPCSEWEDRIIRLKATGCNTVASYIPWLCHEPIRGQFDFSGQLALQQFVTLCLKHEMFFIPRPGPFIMAEMKNEGIPFWVYEEIPEAIPVGWDNRLAPTPTLDYLSEKFLEAASAWYQKLGKVLQPFLYQNSGNVIALQLDNEIGMLSWVSNTPDLTNPMIVAFAKWLQSKHGLALKTKYPRLAIAEIMETTDWVRSPRETYTSQLRVDLGEFLRERYKEYVQTLKTFAIQAGFHNIPFLVNIHGTGGGRGLTYPIGVSQLAETYADDSEIMAGSDIYYGDLTMDVFQDLYLGNAFTKAVTRKNQPVGSMEFNCGDGNFGENYGGRYDISAADLKGRLCIAQSNRLLNYYLFCGGYNGLLSSGKHANERIANTGERHGFAAPIDPEGEENYTFERMKESIQTFQANAAHLAEMEEETDQLFWGFIPDYFMTEFTYPTSKKMQQINQNIERFRGPGAWEIVARSLLLANYRFQAIDVQNQVMDPQQAPVIVLPLAEYLARKLQNKLVDYVKAGGKLLIYGNLPRYDDVGDTCTILQDFLGISYQNHLYDHQQSALSIVGTDWAQDLPELRTSHVQSFSLREGTVFLREKQSGKSCGAEIVYQQGKVICVTADFRGDKAFFQTLLTRLGCQPALTHNFSSHGLILLSSKSTIGRTIHVINLDGFSKNFQICQNKLPLFGDAGITIGSRRGLMLPIEMTSVLGRIVYATGEIYQQDANSVTFRCFGEELIIELMTEKHLKCDQVSTTIQKGTQRTIIAQPEKELVKIYIEKESDCG